MIWTQKQDAFDFFRKAVSFIYREIGVLQRGLDPETTSKAILTSRFFGPDRKRIAKDLYHQTKTDERTPRILEPYEYRTGLTLEDIHRIFDRGNLPRGFGGPRWAQITKTIIELRDLIDAEDWDRTSDVTRFARTLRHNHGLLVDKFHELE